MENDLSVAHGAAWHANRSEPIRIALLEIATGCATSVCRCIRCRRLQGRTVHHPTLALCCSPLRLRRGGRVGGLSHHDAYFVFQAVQSQKIPLTSSGAVFLGRPDFILSGFLWVWGSDPPQAAAPSPREGCLAVGGDDPGPPSGWQSAGVCVVEWLHHLACHLEGDMLNIKERFWHCRSAARSDAAWKKVV